MKLFILMLAFVASPLFADEPVPTLGGPQDAAGIFRAAQSPSAPSGITGISEKKLPKAEKINGVILPAGTKAKMMADGRIVSAVLGAPTRLAGRMFPKNATVQFDANMAVVTAQLPKPTTFDGIALKSATKLYFNGQKLYRLEVQKPQRVRGFAIDRQVDFHPNGLPEFIILGENFKYNGEILKKGMPLQITAEGIPLTPKTLAAQPECDKQKNAFSTWLGENTPFKCASDADCILQKISPYPCTPDVAVAKPGYPKTKEASAELVRRQAQVRKSCMMPETEKRPICEVIKPAATCQSNRCQPRAN